MSERGWDDVIVGGGSAGCVLAGRLSEDPDRRVLLIEAGGEDRHPAIGIPATFPNLFKTDLDWGDETVPQANADDRTFYLPRGKVLGGCSSINAMLYVRGHRADYDGWAASTGDPGWSWERALPLFKRSEGQTAERLADSEHHAADGPLTVSDQRTPMQISRDFVEAAVALGHRRGDDYNGAVQDGVGLYQATQRRGRRHSAASAFLHPVRERRNLEVITRTRVRRLVLAGGRAVAVEAETGGSPRRIAIDGDVVIAAGAYATPKLLMLSGVGPADHLREHGIGVVADLPGVGGNLQDHLYAPMIYRCRTDETLDQAEWLTRAPFHLLDYLLAGRGPFTSPICEAGGFFRSDPSLDAPDLQFHFGPVYFYDHGFQKKKGSFFTVGPTLLTPRSAGTVRLASADPEDRPRIDPRFLSDPDDVRRLVHGYRAGRAIVESQRFAERWLAEPVHPDRVLGDDDEIAAYVRAECNHVYHPVGTARMGRDDDPLAVVDPHLRLRGLQNVRVADASVMPTIPRGNTNAPTIMIAERAAELIRNEKGSGLRSSH